MSTLVLSSHDIKAWRNHYDDILPERMTGIDYFVLSCLDTIESLQADTMNYAVNVCPEQDRVISELRTVIADLLSEAQSQEPFSDDDGRAVLDAARKVVKG